MSGKLSGVVLSFLLVAFVQGCWAEGVNDDRLGIKDSSIESSNSSASESDTSESVKAVKVREILAKHPLIVWKGNLSEERYAFCQKFYRDLVSASPNIEYIEPVLATDDKNHPDLKKYEACRKADHGRIRTLTNHKPFQGLYEIGDHSYKLYREDFDGNPENEEEELIYGKASKEKFLLGEAGHYAFINTKECYWVGADSTHEDFKINSDGSVDFINNPSALILYDEEYYTFDLFYQVTSYKLNISRIKNANYIKPQPFCVAW